MFIRDIAIITPSTEQEEESLPKLMLPVTVLALELSGPAWMEEDLKVDSKYIVEETLVSKSEDPVLATSPLGLIIALFFGKSLHQGSTNAARAATRIQTAARKKSQSLEVRAGLAHGLIDCRDASRASVMTLAERLARAAQSGQTLATMAISRELQRGWDFAPVGTLPRRKEDAIDGALLFKGRKAPAPTPSAFVSDEGYQLIGREVELRILWSEFEHVAAGETRWSAVVAPAGGGKSKLLRTWLTSLGNSCVKVVGAAGSPFGTHPLSLINDLCISLEDELPLEGRGWS